MGDRSRYIAQAEAWLGAKKGDGKYEEMLEWFNKNPKGLKADSENCSEFTVSCALKAISINQPFIPIATTANAQSKMWKSLSRTPVVGSLAYFDYKDGNGISHVEIVTEVTDRDVKTINGNANHKVVRMSRRKTYRYFAGFGVPDWPKEVDMTKWQEAAAKQITLRKGSVGPLVLWLQRYLQSEGFYKSGTQDGVFGSYMEQAVRDFQRSTGGKLYVDGIVGWNTWNYILD